MKENVKMFREITEKMADLYEKKNSNYGNSFTNNWDKMGATSGLVPLNNKVDRLTNLVMDHNKTNHFESIEDTVKDLACYAVMFLIELKTRKNPLDPINHKEQDELLYTVDESGIVSRPLTDKENQDLLNSDK